jgi:hypothetical protein
MLELALAFLAASVGLLLTATACFISMLAVVFWREQAADREPVSVAREPAT